MTGQERIPDDPVARRVLEFKSFDENDAEFGARIGISPQAVSNWRNGHSNVGIGVLTALYHHSTACMNWVLTGEGGMDRKTPTDAQVELTRVKRATHEATRYLNAARSLLVGKKVPTPPGDAVPLDPARHGSEGDSAFQNVRVETGRAARSDEDDQDAQG